MRFSLAFATGLCVFLFTSKVQASEPALPQRVLYVGHRAKEFEPFLKEHFAQVQAVNLAEFKPAAANEFDVVVLDWPQFVTSTPKSERHDKSPFGRREDWGKPTVLLGSAGLNLAVDWKLKGGSGCTCLAPVAYGLTNHQIFQTPMPIDRTAVTQIPTPAAFVHELNLPNVDVIPLVENIKRWDRVINDYKRGWCSYYYEFENVPEVEFFCGGVNEKTPRASALWRQGNLLHFGFEQSPKEMNATGRAMLVNSIAYISRFTEDRPIDETPSVFGSEKIGESRRRARAYFFNPEYKIEWATNVYSAATLKTFNWRDRIAAQAWFETAQAWLHPGPENLLEIDTEVKSLGTPFDRDNFIPKTVAALREEKNRAVAGSVLARYVPAGPGVNAAVEEWEKWWQVNSSYLFYSELGCYRWYVDPLAKRRGIPTKDLRGERRADAH